MERKIYNKPFLVREQFEPQEYCATCNVVKPYSYYGEGVYIDIVTGNDQAVYRPGADDKCQGASAEYFYYGAPSYVKNNFKGVWIEHTTVYKNLQTSAQSDYTNTRDWSMLTSKGSVAVYITPKGLNALVFDTGDGSRPNIDVSTVIDNWDNITKTLS